MDFVVDKLKRKRAEIVGAVAKHEGVPRAGAAALFRKASPGFTSWG
jgi:hypothetical protein